MRDWLPVLHLVGIPTFFFPLFAGYFFNKHIVQGD